MCPTTSTPKGQGFQGAPAGDRSTPVQRYTFVLLGSPHFTRPPLSTVRGETAGVRHGPRHSGTRPRSATDRPPVRRHRPAPVHARPPVLLPRRSPQPGRLRLAALRP